MQCVIMAQTIQLFFTWSVDNFSVAHDVGGHAFSVGHFPNPVGHCPMTNCYFVACMYGETFFSSKYLF